MNITVLNFSPREDGNCAAITSEIQNYYDSANVRIYHVCAFISPCSNCNYECLKPEAICPNLNDRQTAMMDAIRESDLVYFVIPNFCGMPNSVYYAFNERSVGYFNMDRVVMGQYRTVRKRFIIISNTEPAIFTELLQQQTNSSPEILYMKTSRYQKKSIAGDMLESEDARNDLKQFLSQDGEIRLS